MQRPFALACFVIAAAAARPVLAQELPNVALPIVNPSFEASLRGDDGLLKPNGWYAGGKGYRVTLDTIERLDGWHSLRSERIDSIAGGFGVGTQGWGYLARVHGRALRLSGWIRTAEVTSGWAGLWLRVDGVGGTLAFNNMAANGPRGTTPWTRYVIELPVDSGATAVMFGVLHPGSGTAWFDSLHLEVVGPARPRMVAAYSPPPIPAEELSRLLTDAELAPVADSGAAPAVDSAAAAWVRAHAQPIRSLGAVDFSDLAFLRPLLDGKRIVQLGESGHGVREFNLAKVRLIRYLHESLGYDVLAFESSLFGCDRAGRVAASLTAAQLMRGCIFGVWHTEEVLGLFEYVLETQRTPRPLVLTGFDVQASGAADTARATFLAGLASMLDTALARRVRDRDWELRNAIMAAAQGGTMPAEQRDRLVAFYDSLSAWFGDNQQRLAAAHRGDRMTPALARQVATSMTWLTKQHGSPMAARTDARDRGMADNLDFVLDVLHPGRKVIVWAHNFHIQHRGFGGDSTGVLDRQRTMGTWVAERRRRELYTVGLYMYRGSAALNSRQVYRVSAAAPGSLEAILHRAPWKYAFVDLSRAPREPGSGWMTHPLVAKEWGTSAVNMVPRAEYDGLLFVDRTWPPAYLTRAR